MNIAEEEQQREEFRNILRALASTRISLKKKDEFSKMCRRLEGLYQTQNTNPPFRHFYSDIFSVLAEIKQGDTPGIIDILGENLSELRKRYKPLNTNSLGEIIDIGDNLKKLHDHVSLDIARFSYIDALNINTFGGEILADVQAAKIETNQLRDSVKETQAQQKDTARKLENQQEEYIAILGIFAAIVIAFSTGSGYLSGAIANIAETSLSRLASIIILCGLTLMNTLFLLMYFVGRLINKPLSIVWWQYLFTNALLIILLFCAYFSPWLLHCPH